MYPPGRYVGIAGDIRTSNLGGFAFCLYDMPRAGRAYVFNQPR